ncbi:hypothetical protein M758_1G232400 [Ceratodon purpureus]|nr:hypothetical protein M758_1G232400 [Ceratodon purpureus]
MSTPNDAVVPSPEKPTIRGPITYGVVRNELDTLVWLKHPGANDKKARYYAAALEDWTAQVTILTHRVDKKKTDIDSVYNEIYHLVGFYSAFQGLLFTAVAQATTLTCRNWPIPFVLSLLATIFVITGVIQKFGASSALWKKYTIKRSTRETLIKRIKRLRREGNNGEDTEEFLDKVIGKVDGVLKKKSSLKKLSDKLEEVLYPSLLVIAIILFSATISVAIWYILCNSGKPLAAR